MTSMTPGLCDTSAFIGQEGRGLELAALDMDLAVSVVVLGELRRGVLSASTVEARSSRLATYEIAASLSPLPVDRAVADAWATLVTRLRESGTKMEVNDSWIAATALAHGMSVVTQDDDFDVVPGLEIVKI